MAEEKDKACGDKIERRADGRVDIDERHVIVDERSRFGDLEIDTVIGANNKGAIMAINDRGTWRLFMRLLSGNLADMAISAFIRHSSTGYTP